MRRRKQCAKCPWKVSTNPHDIPDGYSEEKHADLSCTIADQANPWNPEAQMHIMTCHEFPVGEEQPCVGWLINQLGEGNNIQLRIAVLHKRISAAVDLDGEQHNTLEDTLPREEA